MKYDEMCQNQYNDKENVNTLVLTSLGWFFQCSLVSPNKKTNLQTKQVVPARRFVYVMKVNKVTE